MTGRWIETPSSVGDSRAEIVAYDAKTHRVFVTHARAAAVTVLDIKPDNSLSLAEKMVLPGDDNQEVNSAATHAGILALAVARTHPGVDAEHIPGEVRLYDTATLQPLHTVTVGYLPDMLVFTPDGRQLLVANEGQPNPSVTHNPLGTISIIHMAELIDPANAYRPSVPSSFVKTVTFRDFNRDGSRAHEWPEEIRTLFPGTTRAADVEPEYIAVAPDSRTAVVVLQEHNAYALIDILTATVTAVRSFGSKDHMVPGWGMDPSDQDGGIRIANWPVRGLFQPDAIAWYTAGNQRSYFVTANEGDDANYPGFKEAVRVSDLTLDPKSFPEADTLQQKQSLGRLQTPRSLGDSDGDGDVDVLYAFGARSFSLWDAKTGRLVYDSGSSFAVHVARYFPEGFNTNNAQNRMDSRSDNRGSEPEGVVIGAVNDHSYAFIGLERTGGIMVYDITEPESPKFVQYVPQRDFQATTGALRAGRGGDLGPEGLAFVHATDSPSGHPLLLVGNEISGSTTVYTIETY